jgi:hypothetical protein
VQTLVLQHIKNLEKSLGLFLIKRENPQKIVVFGQQVRNGLRNEKSGSVSFFLLLIVNFVQSLGKIHRAVFEKNVN